MTFHSFIRNHSVDLRWHYKKIADDFGWKVSDRYFSWPKRLKLKNKDFAIISNDCVAGVIYHRLGMQYLSPTVWTYIFPDEYLRLLGNFRWYLHQPLEFTSHPKHLCQVHDRFGHVQSDRSYPTGVLGGDVEIHFLHCRTQQEALQQWIRRLERTNFERVFAVFVDNGYSGFREEYFEQFLRLPLKHKLFVSKKSIGNCPYAVQAENKMHIERSIDLVKWLNLELDWQTKNCPVEPAELTPLHQVEEVTV